MKKGNKVVFHNEKDLVKDILENNKIHNELGFGKVVQLLSKSFLENGKHKEEAILEVDRVLFENNIDTNVFGRKMVIENIVEDVFQKGLELVQVDSIKITKSEWAAIQSLEDEKVRKLAYVMLFHAKKEGKVYNKNCIWFNRSLSSLFLEAKVNNVSGNYERGMMMKELFTKGLVVDSNSNSNIALKLLFVDYDEDSEIEFEITKFDNILFHYDVANGKNVKICECCGKVFEIKKGRGMAKQKFCSDKCKDKVRKEKVKINKRNHDLKNKLKIIS